MELNNTAHVSAGDIKRFVHGDQWEGAGGHEIGKPVTEITDWVFARIPAPEGYVLRGPDVRINDDALCWWSETGQWARVRDVWPTLGNNVLIADLLRVARKKKWKVYFATKTDAVPKAGKLVGTRIELLEGHRWMDVGELVREGDRYRMADGDQWMTADFNQKGFPVPDKAEDNGFISYCRPVHPGHRFWFISSSGSDETGRGTRDLPWGTKEHGIRRIEKGAKQLGTPMFGTIIDESGAGVHHFDMDAPDIVTPGTTAPNNLKATHRKGGTDSSEAGKVYLPGKKRIRPKHWSRQDISRFMKRLNARYPLYRAMCIGDQLKGSDMVCVREEGHWNWGSVGSVFQGGIGMPVDECPWIAARAHAPEEGMSKKDMGMALIEHKLGEIYEIVASLKE